MKAHSDAPGTGRLVGAVATGVALLALFASAFVLAGHDPEPHDVPIGVVAEAAETDELRTSLERQAPGGYDLTRFDTEAQARQAIGDRAVYAAVVMGPQGDRLLVASAAGAAVASLLEGVLGGRAQATGRALHVEDVVPLAPGDPRGGTIGLLVLPLVIASILGGTVIALLASRKDVAAAILPLLALAAAGGTALLTPARLVDALPGPLAALIAVAALGVLAIAAVSRGLVAMAGTRAVGAAFLLFILIGNLGSGANSAPELLPAFWRSLGPYLPPGATATGLRNVAYFDGAAMTMPLVVLAGWAALGIVLTLAARTRRSDEAPQEGLAAHSTLATGVAS